MKLLVITDNRELIVSTFVKGEIVKPDVKGVNQYLGYCLLGVIGIVWIGIGIYFLKNYVLRKR